ncbi:MAG: UDP-N-acetylmuramoyl-L-alanine--D-glutamate ligase [Deltaproteobacteria bacterium]|nr:UDP-N-acetylmuramoyl-L-alanine--D-glutamate ligase [Deltaproteobacteria bacterium]
MLVVGLGTSGLAALRLLCRKGAVVIANDQRDEAALGETAELARREGAELALGGHDPALFTSVDAIVLSPGVPRIEALRAAEARGVPIISELELSSRFVQATIVGITGTNGKSTVTSLVGLMCENSGRPTFIGGNLGRPLAEIVGSEAAGPSGIAVVEISSFQLERLERLRVQVAALLNVTDDHLDRYRSFDEYAAVKGRIFERQQPEDASVVPAGDRLCQALVSGSAARRFSFGGDSGAVRVIDDRIVDQTSGLSFPIDELKLNGEHNLWNVCAAALLARLVGVPTKQIQEVLASFDGLPHRMQKIRELGGVAYYDDSKATNVGATVAALDGLCRRRGKVVLIAGGIDKGGSYAPLRARLEHCGRAVVLIGQAASLIRAALNGCAIEIEQAPTMESAVQAASRLARPGDVVLLAPACSSFDMFRSYAQRGELFQRAVRALSEGST